MLKYICVFFVFVNLSTFSQEKENQIATIKKEKQEFLLPPKPKENTLTLEEQGFKLVIVGERKVYKKEVNGILIEFIPNEN